MFRSTGQWDYTIQTDDRSLGEAWIHAPAVELDDVTLIFGGDNPADEPVLAVHDIDIAIPAGQFVAVVGPSGCGKTTILNMLAGLIKPTRGSVKRHGTDVDGPSRDIGYMLARSALSPWRTARKNVEFGLEIRGVPKRERRERAMDLLKTVSLDQFANAFPAQLSQGMNQRVAIARTLAIDPDLWLMDEPFGALDAQTRLTVQAEFIRLWESARTPDGHLRHPRPRRGSAARRSSHRYDGETGPDQVRHPHRPATTTRHRRAALRSELSRTPNTGSGRSCAMKSSDDIVREADMADGSRRGDERHPDGRGSAGHAPARNPRGSTGCARSTSPCSWVASPCSC